MLFIKQFKWLLLTIFFVVPFYVTAHHIVVDNTVDFNNMLQTVKAGDTIIWKDGIYNDLKINFKPTQNGTAQAYIVLKAQTAGKVIFKGSSQLFVAGSYLQAEGFLFEGVNTLDNGDNVIEFGSQFKDNDNTHHCRVTNCAVVNYTPKDAEVLQYSILLKGSYNEVDHCYFLGKSNKGPTLVVAYKKSKDYVDGSDAAPSTHHHIHHNYFGFRTYTENGGECMRIGDSKTSFTKGYNVIENNFFEDEKIEAEVISNKSFCNIYRFNSFVNNDGALVLRHGQQCVVYGNYFNSPASKNTSGGIRIINPYQTVFNNYIENVAGGSSVMKSPICIMAGLKGSALNEYYPADSAIVAYNTVYNAVGPAITLGVGNAAKGKPFEAPQHVWVEGNSVMNTKGKNPVVFQIENTESTYLAQQNYYYNSISVDKGFQKITQSDVVSTNITSNKNININKTLVNVINSRLAKYNIFLNDTDITHFNPAWIVTKKDVGVSWLH
ncbi:polysaccharide lyase 6 family protein [Ferruginibacter yonginensis]|uniref:Polysaccharide lyase 6 family protein n=1 Tax=Ferruginibacter yonginensis TaxID=1310416 RepID=A0ABV8QQF7_9BACT